MEKTNQALRILASIKVGGGQRSKMKRKIGQWKQSNQRRPHVQGLKGSPTKESTSVNLTNKNKEYIICIECREIFFIRIGVLH